MEEGGAPHRKTIPPSPRESYRADIDPNSDALPNIAQLREVGTMVVALGIVSADLALIAIETGWPTAQPTRARSSPVR